MITFTNSDVQWLLKKQRPTQFGDNKNYPGGPRFWWKTEVDKHGTTRTEEPSEPTPGA